MSGNTPESESPGFAVAEGSGYQQYDKQDAFPSAVTTIPEKYKGTRADQDDMVLLGKKQVLRRNFKFTTILGFASTGNYGWSQTIVSHLAD
jgi:choline transport protein